MGWLKRGPRREPARPGSNRVAASGPVDLAGELARLNSPGAAAGRALAEIRRFAAESPDPGSTSLLRALERGAESGQLALPPLPEVVLRVRQRIDAPEVRMAELEREIQLDPALATRIVGVANSPFYGAVRPAGSVGEAVVRLGLRQTRHMVLALALRSRVLRAPGRDAEVSALWTHALAAALCAQSLAALEGLDPDEASLLGLIHDVGRIAVLATQAELERASRGQERTEPAAQARVSDALHPALGAMLADAWSLSPSVVGAISHHHAPASAPAALQPLARIAAAADALARLLPEAPATTEPPPLDGIDADTARAALDEAREAYADLSKVL